MYRALSRLIKLQKTNKHTKEKRLKRKHVYDSLLHTSAKHIQILILRKSQSHLIKKKINENTCMTCYCALGPKIYKSLFCANGLILN